MIERLVRKLELRDQVTPDEIEALSGLLGEEEHYPRRAEIVRAYEHQTSSRLLVDGWAARAKTLANGARQITEMHVPGDFIDLHSFMVKRLDHSIVALTPCTIVAVPHERLRLLTEQHPHLTRLLWLTTLVDAAIHREWMTMMGRADARQNVAHVICELYLRLETVGLAGDNSFDLPLTQEELGDVCGLTAVHVNRVLQELRGEGLIMSKARTVRIPDWNALARAGQFDPIYLNLINEPR